MNGTRVVCVGGSDAGVAAALRARELDPGREVTVVLADAYPSFSICGIPYYLDLAYTPPLGSPWDAVQAATQAWSASPEFRRHDQLRGPLRA